jgi:hypothetical protein
MLGRSFRRYSAFLGGSLRKAPARKSRAMTMGWQQLDQASELLTKELRRVLSNFFFHGFAHK